MPKRTQASATPQSLALEKLLTVKDVADLLQLSTVKVYRLMNFSGLPSVKLDRSRRFKPAEVQAWIEQHKEVS